jgi:hypothetical protein
MTSWVRGLLGSVVRGGFWSSRVNAVVLERYGLCSPEWLLGLLRSHLEPRGLLAASGGRPALTEGVIHHQDVRRALGQPRAVPPERLLVALRWALLGPDIGGLWRIRGVRVAATDLEFSAGIGSEARGSGTDLRGRRGRPGRGRAGGGGDGVPRAPPEPADEPPHAAIINVTAASPADASHRISLYQRTGSHDV